MADNDRKSQKPPKTLPVNLPKGLVADSSGVNFHHVQSVYNEIATHFNQTRVYMWPKVKEYIKSLPAHSMVLDVGCGNGRNMTMRTDELFYIGLDVSTGLLKFVGSDKKKCTVASVQENIPFRNNTVDSIMSIAVIHHLVDASQRQKSVFEIERCLKVGGTALIYVWTKEQKKFQNLSKDVLIPWQLQEVYDDNNNNKQNVNNKKRKLNNDNTPTSSSSKACSSGASTIAKNVEGAKKNGISKTLWRYYHLFEEKELENLIHKTKSLKIIEAGKQYHNWYVIVQKQYVTNDSTVKCCIE